jgi:simple sugar transport system permease protein
METNAKNIPVTENSAPAAKEQPAKKAPFARIVRRSNLTKGQIFLYKAITILGAVVISLLYLWIVGKKNPFEAVMYIVEGTICFNSNGLVQSKFFSFLKFLTILFAISLALIPAYRMRYWNIGAQGQVLIGGLLTACCMIYMGGKAPSAVIILVSLVAGGLGGAIWAYIPALFKARWNTNETLFTLMMNYIAILLVNLSTNIWRGKASAMTTINMTSEAGWFPKWDLPNVRGEEYVMIPLILVLLLMGFIFFYVKYTKHGYEISVVGSSVATARYTGINVRHVIRRTVALSGLICGIIGFFLVSNFDHTISSSTDQGYGFTAIIVAWLAGLNPFKSLGYSALIIFLDKGARNLADSGFATSLNSYSCEFVVFLLILAILLGHFFSQYGIVFRKNKDRLEKSLTSNLVLSDNKEEK